MRNAAPLTRPFHRRILPAALALLLLAPWPSGRAQTATVAPPPTELTRSVDPRVGVLGDGSCVIGPTLPFGSVHPSPDTPDGGHDGYHPDRPIRGFSQTHVSGTGWGHYGNLLVSPQVGLAVGETEHDSPKADERATAYEYRVRLARYDILAEFAPTAHAVFYQFTFPRSDEATLAIDAAHMIPGDIATKIRSSVKDGQVNFGADGRSISGFGAYSGGFGSGVYKVYFHAELDRPAAAFGTWKNGQISEGSRAVALDKAEDRVGGFARYRTAAGDMVKMKVGVSFRSVEHARESLQREIPGWDYAATRDAARQAWEDTLGCIRVEGADETQRTLFYTALYHAFVMPRDRTGEFERFAPGAPMWDDHYAVWDTWRTLYPLMTLIRPDMVRGTVQSFIERQRVDRLVVDTFIAGRDRNGEQGGNDVDNIIADAYVKKLSGIDWQGAYGVMRFNADLRRASYPDNGPMKDRYRQAGWIPASVMSVSNTLEYAYNDFCASEVAAGLGLTADADAYRARSRKWEALWNPDAESDGFKGFVVPKKETGEWTPLDPKAYGGSWKGDYYEANAWGYSYFVPHQVGRLVELMGGREPFVQRLEHGLKNKLVEFGNEPAFLTPQLFHYAGRPDLSADWVRRITNTRYTLRGYPGDDDSGAMSSYFVWVKLGLFPNAGQDIYYLTGPVFERVVVQRPEDGPLEITRTGKGDYVQSAMLNGKPLERSWLRHGELQGNAKLAFTMSETPTAWARQGPPPPSL